LKSAPVSATDVVFHVDADGEVAAKSEAVYQPVDESDT